MALLLSQKSGIASDGITPSSATNFLIQNSFLEASDAVIYSVSVVEFTMIGYLKLFQLTAPSLYENIKSDVDFLSSMSDMKSEFVYPYNHKSSLSKIKK